MYRKRATLLSLNSFKLLPKVCRSSPTSLNCVITLTFSQTLSTATERLYFDNSNGYKTQSPHGFDSQDGDGRSQDFHFGKNELPIDENKQEPLGTNGILASHNSGFGYSNSFRNEFKQDPFRQNGSSVSSGYNVAMRASNFGDSEGRINGFQSASDKGNGYFTSGHNNTEGQRSEFQNSTSVQNGGNHVNAKQHSFDSSNASSSRQQLHMNGNSPLGLASQNTLDADSMANRSYAQSPLGLRSNFGAHGGSYNVGNVERNFDKYVPQTAGNVQHMQPNYYEPNSGVHQQSFSRGSTLNDGSSEDNEEIKLSGTLEELDHFLKEENLEVVVQVLDLLEKNSIPVDLSRYLCLLNACGENNSLEQARYIHGHLMRSIPNLELSTYNRILEMYLNCESMEDAFSVFDQMPRNFTSWDTMISGLVKNGYPESAIDLFTEFKGLGLGLVPDGEMYFGVFSACSAICDVIQGKLHFESMSKDYGIVPSMEHYVRMVDMLGSSGHTDEALEFIEKMPIEPSVEVWETLMNVSRMQGNLELGDRCAELVELLDPSRLDEQARAGYILVKASDLAKEKEKKKSSGQSPLEIRSRTHEFRAGDRSHPDHEKLYELLRGMRHQMREAGYVAETKFVLHDIDQESKEEALLSHSERLAVAKGLLSTPARSTMRIIKNLRVCGDCHNAMKIISNLIGRELIMRDAKRFHHFKDGVCSCRDYW